MNAPYVAPAYLLQRFNCPYCGALAQQTWITSSNLRSKDQRIKDVAISICESCSDSSVWIEDLNSMGPNPFGRLGTPSHNESHSSVAKASTVPLQGKIVYPRGSPASMPAKDMPEEIKRDYLEAREVVNESPRSAASLLRLCVQKLMPVLGEKGKDINQDIASLVKKGLPVSIQQALDSLRLIGNQAVHPGTTDLNDDRDTALALFSLLNVIVERLITQPKQIEEIFNKLPESKRHAITERDNK